MRSTRLCLGFLGLLVATTTAGAQDPDYILSVENREVLPLGSFTLEVGVDSTQGEPLVGWQYSVCHDPAELSIESAVLADPVIAVSGSPPSFASFHFADDGYSLGVVWMGPSLDALPPSISALSVGTYTHSLAAGDSTSVTLCGSIGTPPLSSGVLPLLGGITILPITVDGSITVLDLYPWIRGDVNDDGVVNLADGVFLLNELFQGGPAGTCVAAKDANSDSTVDAADAIFLFTALFLDGPPPAAPYPGCETLNADCSFQSSCF